MEAKHSLGPWTPRFTRHGGVVVACHIDDAMRGSLNPVCLSGGSVGDTARTPDEISANAHLIASAPDLLSVLRDCLSYMDAMAVLRGGEADELRVKCRAAIAKATGDN